MSDLSLTQQLAERTKKFIASSGLTQKELAKLLRVDKGNFSKFLSGQVGLNSDTTLQLVRLMNLSPRSLQLKFGAPEQTRARLLHLQQNGVEMRLSNDGSGWVAKEGDTAADPNNQGGDITQTAKYGGDPSDDDLIDTLRAVDNYHKQAREAIANWFANYRSAKVNKGSTEGVRHIDDNTRSRTPGPRPDRFSTPEKLREHLEFVHRERKKSEEQLELQAELDRERKLYWDARVKTLRKQDGQ